MCQAESLLTLSERPKKEAVGWGKRVCLHMCMCVCVCVYKYLAPHATRRPGRLPRGGGISAETEA